MPLTTDDVLAILRGDVEKCGSQLALAKRIGCSSAYLSDVLAGRRGPGRKILLHYGLIRTPTYDRKAKRSAA